MKKGKYSNFLKEAEIYAKNGSCLRRTFGCVIVKHNKIISRGVTKNLQELKPCIFCNRKDSPSGKNYDLCQSVHAEQDALLKINRKESKNSMVFIVGLNANGEINEKPYICNICKKLLIKSKVRKVILGLSDGNYIEKTKNNMVFELERELFYN